jgi:hypothetical protein
LREGGGSSLLSAGCHAVGELLFFMNDEGTEMVNFATRLWFPSLAPSQDSITRWKLLKPYDHINHRRRYPHRVKPANFLLVAHDDPLVALPTGLERAHLTPIAPFSRERVEWPGLRWRNRFDGNIVSLTTRQDGEPGKVRVQTYRDLVTDYRFHPDPKTADSDGRPVRRGTVGVLRRRPVLATGIRYVGKETVRRIEEESGMLRLSDDPFTEYRDEAEEFEEVRAALIQARNDGMITVADVMRESGASRRTVQYWLNGTQVPRSQELRDAIGRLVRAKR